MIASISPDVIQISTAPSLLDWMQFGVMTILATGSIISATFAIRAFNTAQKIRRVSTYLELKRLVTEINGQVLSTDENLKYANDAAYGRDEDNIPARQRWVLFGVLNLVEVAYRAKELGDNEKYIDMKLGHLLDRVLKSWEDSNGQLHERDDIYNIFYYGGYDPGFIDYARGLYEDFDKWCRNEDATKERNAAKRPRGVD